MSTNADAPIVAMASATKERVVVAGDRVAFAILIVVRDRAVICPVWERRERSEEGKR